MSVIRLAASKAGARPASLIFFHGLGDTGDGWRFLANEISRTPALQHINVVLPTAPTILISSFNIEVPGWFDISAFDKKGEPTPGQDVEGVTKSLEYLQKLLDEEISRGIPADRIVIGGFSQGCALAEATAVIGSQKVAGFLCLSGYLPIHAELVKRLQGKPITNIDTPIYMLHGELDDIVPVYTGARSRDGFNDIYGFTAVDWKEYPGISHSVSREGVADIITWLARILPA